MMSSKQSAYGCVTGCAAILALLLTTPAPALPPPPGNDSPAAPFVIGPSVPVVEHGTTVLAADDISVTTLPAPADDVDGPDVFYSFAPLTSDTYRVQLIPWQRAPVRSSDRRFTIYIQDESDTFLAGARAGGSLYPVYFDAVLATGRVYRIGVDYNATTHDNFPFTLIVDTIPATAPDDCGTAEALGTTLPYAVLNDIDGASGDYSFVGGTGRCSVAGDTTAPGIDHVYRFTPHESGDYAIELVSSGFNGVLYVNTSCPPDFPSGCLGASNHQGKHELVVVTLEADTQYYIYVDNDSTTLNTGNYTLIVDTAFGYEINEIEPNDSFASACPLDTPLNGGQLVGPLDEDWWAVAGETGDRVYAWVNNGGTGNSTLDTDLAFYAADGSSLIEFDDLDGDGADSPIEDLRYIYATSAPVIAGVALTSDATHYLRVTDQNPAGTVHRYRFHVGVEPGTREPAAEVEPNETLAQANYSGKHYYSGVVDVTGDVDTFAFEATVGDRVFVALDGDPERDGTGSDSPNDDPRAFHAKLIIYDPDEDVLISDISDSNSIQSPPDYPAQGGFFFARTTGTHYVQVQAQSTLSQVGPEETYELAIFLNSAAPDLIEDVDPVVTLTPDYDVDTIGVEAADNAPGDTGICSVSLVNDTNLQITGLSFTEGDPVVTFTIELIDPGSSGLGDLVVADCATNTTQETARIDVDAPVCAGFNFSNRTRTSLHDPLFIKDNEPSGPGLDSVLTISETGAVTDVNVTITIETIRPPDIDAFLISPEGTSVELITDLGSSLAFDITEATFDDDAEETMPFLSGDAPYTGTWLPEDPAGLAQVNGEEALGDWKLNVRDDSSSASGGARLVRWTLDLDAGFANLESFAGTASDTEGTDSGIASIELINADNVALSLPWDFLPGDQVVEYVVTLVDTSLNGSGTIVVTDMSENTCERVIALNGFPDGAGPDNSGEVTTDLKLKAEVQADIPPSTPAGVVSTIPVPDAGLVGEVEVDLTIDTKEVGRLASTLTHDGEFASLINRVGMDDRGSAGLTKDNMDIDFDDDASVGDDAHEEPALGSVAFRGLHQPDGRGEFIGDGITSDRRENMLLNLGGSDAIGNWDLHVGDYRMMSSTDTTFRRWALTLKMPCGEERYVGRAIDLAPGTGVCSIALALGADNLAVDASFDLGDDVVDYVVTLIDPALPGSGTLDVTDCNSNVTQVPISLQPEADDQDPPVIAGSVNQTTFEFEGSATDQEPTDSGIESVEVLPYGNNLQIVSVTPDPPNGAAGVDFVVGLVNPAENGQGYVRVTDVCGWRTHVLVEIDANTPVCTGSVGRTKRYLSTDLPQAIPDNNSGGVVSSIVVSDPDIVEDVNVTFNITHPFDADIDMWMSAPVFRSLFSDIGFTGNDFIDTTLDDEAPAPIPDSSSEAPFTGSYQAEGGPVFDVLDGDPAAGTYSLYVVDDKDNDTGTFESWSLTIESSTFPDRWDGRAEDGEGLASGICAIWNPEDGPTNLNVVVDPFTPGDRIVRYSVELINPSIAGEADIFVEDCAGNACVVPISLSGSAGPPVPEPGGSVCAVPGDCTGAYEGADCIAGICYVPKNRYLSIDPTTNEEAVAYQVEITEAVDYPGAVGRAWWVDAPVCYDYPNGDPVPGATECEGSDYFGWVSHTSAAPVTRTWSEVPLHITGCGIAPAVLYEIRASADDGANFSDALAINTAHNPEGDAQSWGDITGGPVSGMPGLWLPPERATNFGDVGNAIRTFENRTDGSGSPPRVWVDVEINQVISLGDIQFIIKAFEGTAYADLNLPLIGVDPADCP